MPARLCARIRLLSWWAASWPPTNVTACDKGTGISQRGIGDWNWLARTRGTGLARTRGTAPASARPGNGIGQLALGEQDQDWRARNHGTAPASAGPGNGIS